MSTDKLDLSLLPYDEWVAFFFDRPVMKEDEDDDDLFRPRPTPWDDYDIELDIFTERPAVLVEHVRRLCLEFGTLPRTHSWSQIDQGVWGVLMLPCECSNHIVSDKVPLALRLSCIQAMYHVFADAVATLPKGVPMETCFFMWWDIIAGAFFMEHGHWSHEVFHPEREDVRQVHDVILDTLVRILALEDRRCQGAALHGLGHLHHPQGAEIVQKFIDVHRAELSDSDQARPPWLEACRDGTVM